MSELLTQRPKGVELPLGLEKINRNKKSQGIFPLTSLFI
ncbi:protein of unknown function [[Clostridium] ultunense Esp]|uniref:Uncharacterized protein n=1 Tax=[Clostridium] ultunense Esp TaxID=1288971 RepID=A0A1M4PMG5_9FIRM|nr:protein of unknown function [[Clostridium] ultunense Esp]